MCICLILGHNGLVSVSHFSDASSLQVFTIGCISCKKVIVLKQRPVLDGAAVTEEIVPGFKFSRCSHILSLLRHYIVKELELKV